VSVLEATTYLAPLPLGCRYAIAEAKGGTEQVLTKPDSEAAISRNHRSDRIAFKGF
jgi:hypothetical protein